MDKYNFDNLISEVSRDVSIDEGEEGIRNILVNIYRFGPIPIHELSANVSIAVPVVSAVRRVLEKIGVCERKGGVVLTSNGIEILECGSITSRLPKLVSGYRMADWIDPLVEKILDIQKGRPSPDFSLDQSHVDATSLALRAAYLHDNDSVEGRKIAFVGDDDLTSLALGIFMSEFGIKTSKITLFDVDKRVLKFVREASIEIGLDIETVECDIRDGIPVPHMESYDVFFTDPPYTVDGLRLFVSSGVSMLMRGVGRKAFVSFGPKSPDRMLEGFDAILEMGLVVQEMTPHFNRYVGNQMNAGSSSMIRCVTTRDSKPLNNIDIGKIYTADQK